MLMSCWNVIKNPEHQIGFYFNMCLSGVIGALIVLLITHFLQPAQPSIGTVNVTGIVEKFIKLESNKQLPQAMLKNEVSAFGITLDKEIKMFSKQHHVVLFLREAVISGSQDYTKDIQAIMQQRIDKFNKDK